MLLWTSFLLAFSALLPIINPVGSAVVFLGLMGELPVDVYRSMARRIAINNVIFLAVIELLGSAILRFFGLSLPIVQVAGGIVISSIGWSMLNASDTHQSEPAKQAEAKAEYADTGMETLRQKAFYPFTFPVTSGPGTLVVTLTLGAHIAAPGWAGQILGHLGLFLAIVVISALVYVCYANAPRLTQAINPSTVHGVVRVMAFILLCIGVQILWNGITGLLATLKFI